MRLLCTNDDGYLAKGLEVLAEAARTLGAVSIVAPDREQSATSNSLTIHHPLRARRASDGAIVVDGTPTDCVILAVGELLEQRPDVCLSGINHGPNMGEDVFYSGTVAAAIEGAMQGAPALAVSLVTREITDFREPAAFVGRLARRVMERGLARRQLLNVNVPFLPWDEIRGVAVTRLGSRVYRDTLVRKVDPRGRDYYWIGGEDPVWDPREGTDFNAVHDGWVSVTPLKLDLTDEPAMGTLDAWNLEK